MPTNLDPIEAFDKAVCEAMKGGADRRAAVAAVALKNPRLHREFVIATNRDAKTDQKLVQSLRI
jgi:hypothetical protein